MIFGKRIAAMAAMATVSLGLTASSGAKSLHTTSLRRTTTSAPLPQYHLRMHHLHTGEDIDVVYRVGDTYIPAALDQLNYFLRDHRTQDVSSYDPKEFDVLHAIMTRLGRPNGIIDIICGYRTPESNNFLHTLGPDTGVAEHSQHMLAKAIDIRVPGVSTPARSEERRVGKECRSRWSPY